MSLEKCVQRRAVVTVNTRNSYTNVHFKFKIQMNYLNDCTWVGTDVHMRLNEMFLSLNCTGYAAVLNL
jgi:hypothetical protein